MNCPANGWALQVLVENGSEPTFSDTSERYAVVMEDLKRVKTFSANRYGTGSLSLLSSCVRQKPTMVSGRMVLQPGSDAMIKWLPRILRSTINGIPSNADNRFSVLLHRDKGVFRLTGCVVNSATFYSATASSGPEEELVSLAITIYGMLEQYDGWPDPSPAYVSEEPYNHVDGTVYLGSNMLFKKFALTIDNGLVPSGMFASLSPRCWRSSGRKVSLAIESPFEESGLVIAKSMGGIYRYGYVAISNNDSTVTFSMPGLINNYRSPVVQDTGPVPLHFVLDAYKVGTNPEVVVNHDQWYA